MDKVGDLLTRIRNGYMASKKEVYVPYSNLSLSITKILKEEGFIENYTPEERIIKIALKYDNKAPALTGAERVSKPGRRVYQGGKHLPYVLNGIGVAIISTPKGVMTDRKARKEGVGGEVMAYIW